MKDTGIFSKIFSLSLTALFCCVVTMSLPSYAWAKKSGRHGLNVYTKVQGDPWREIVRGQITVVRSDGIVMDGEVFSFAGARLQGDHEAELLYTDIYPGLTASVVYYAGRIEKITVHNLSRPLVIRDKKFIEQERSRAFKGR